MAAPSSLYVTPYYKNPDRHRADKLALQTDARKAYDLAFQGDTKGASQIILDWALHCHFVNNFEAALVLMYEGHLFLEAALLMNPDEWNSRAFLPWVEKVFWPQADVMSRAMNNHGCWGLLGMVLADTVLKWDWSVRGYFPALWDRIKHSIGPEGQMVHEITRTTSGIWYSYFALAPLFRTCQIFDCPDLVEKGLHWLFKYCKNPYSWPYKPAEGFWGKIEQFLYPHDKNLVVPRQNDWPANLYAEAGEVLGNVEWSNWPRPPIENVNIFRNRRNGPSLYCSVTP